MPRQPASYLPRGERQQKAESPTSGLRYLPHAPVTAKCLRFTCCTDKGSSAASPPGLGLARDSRAVERRLKPFPPLHMLRNRCAHLH